MKPQAQQPQKNTQPQNSGQQRSSTSQNPDTESRGRSPQADGTWNDRDKNSTSTPTSTSKDWSPASSKQYDDIKPRDSKFNATDIDKSSRQLDEDMSFNRDTTRETPDDDVKSQKKSGDVEREGTAQKTNRGSMEQDYSKNKSTNK